MLLVFDSVADFGFYKKKLLAVSSHGPHSGAVRWGVWVLAKGHFVPRILTVSNIYCNMSPKYVADAIM